MHPDRADVIVTDGFTGNVALKSLEGALRSLAGVVFRVLDATPEAREASTVLLPLLLAAAEIYDPDVTGGAVLLGVDGVCIISHGSSSARAITNAVSVAADCVATEVVAHMKKAVAHAG
jgi:phosphate acyltransferase